MDTTRNRIICILVILTCASLACNMFGMEDPPAKPAAPAEESQPTEIVETIEVSQENLATEIPPSQPPAGCVWVFNYDESIKALATGGGDPKMDAQYIYSSPLDDSQITTSYEFAGNQGCDTQFIFTTHSFPIISVLVPGESQTIDVKFEWKLNGAPECTAMTIGGLTSYTIGDIVISARQDDITLSTTPDGFVSSSGSFVVPTGQIGDKLTITQHGSSGSLGGNVFLKYECKKITDGF